MLVFLNLVEHDVSVTAEAFVSFCVDTILIVVRESVHNNIWLGTRHMHTTAAALDLAALDLTIVTFSDLEAWSEDLVHLDPLNQLLCAFTLDIDTHHLAVADG